MTRPAGPERLPAGARLGPYEIQAVIGAGGMGVVYRARDSRLDRIVAIKVLSAGVEPDPSFQERFSREARTLSSLEHPHIGAVYDVGQQDGVPYLVMQHLEGETLASRLAKGPLPFEHVLTLGIQVADALAAAHERDIVHRDLKPANIMLTKSGAKLLDFGLAKPRERVLTSPVHDAVTGAAAPGASPLTERGAILGTFHYMSPEQLRGQEADARSDIFSPGATLYEALSGRRPFDAADTASQIAAILDRDPPSLADPGAESVDHPGPSFLFLRLDAAWRSGAGRKISRSVVPLAC
jgi:serine/threonine protein kinase